MTKLLQHLSATLVLSVLLVAVVAWGFHAPLFGDGERYGLAVLRFLLTVCTIMWIGLLFFVHFVMFPALGRLPADLEPAVYRHLAPEAFFWLRHAALLAIAIGLAILFLDGRLGDALLLRGPARVPGLAFWIAAYMAAGSWLLVWPNLKRAGAEGDISDGRRARSLWLALTFSRINLLLSLPMLYCLATAEALAAS